jgi:hypothetical protein
MRVIGISVEQEHAYQHIQDTFRIDVAVTNLIDMRSVEPEMNFAT